MTNLPAKIDAGPIVSVKREAVITTRFMDMHSGGETTIAPFDKIYVECPEKLARIYFEAVFDECPDSVRCHCCGENFSVSDSADIEQASGYDRNADHVGYDGNNVRWQPRERYSSVYVDCDGRTSGYTSDWKWRYEGGSDLAEYLNRDDVLFVPAATVAQWFLDNPDQQPCNDGADCDGFEDDDEYYRLEG